MTLKNSSDCLRRMLKFPFTLLLALPFLFFKLTHRIQKRHLALNYITTKTHGRIRFFFDNIQNGFCCFFVIQIMRFPKNSEKTFLYVLLFKTESISEYHSIIWSIDDGSIWPMKISKIAPSMKENQRLKSNTHTCTHRCGDQWLFWIKC